MPIRDRSNRRLVRLGVIRLGHKEKQTKKRKDGTTYEVEYPTQDDHFVLTDAPELAEVYGEQPRELDVLLPFPDVTRNFDAYYQVWAGGVLVCQGDGEQVLYSTPFTVQVSDKGATHVYNASGDTLVSNGIAQVRFTWNGSIFKPGDTVACPGQSADLYPHCAACKLNGMLKVMMSDPRLFRMGYYQVSTGSKRNYDTIMGTLEMLPAERLNGIPFKLRMVEESTTYKDSNGKRAKGTKWFLQLEPDPAFTRHLYTRMTRSMMGLPEPVAQLPAGPQWGDFDDAEPAAPPPLAQDQEPDEPATSATEEPEQPMASPHKWTLQEALELCQWTRNDLGLTDPQMLAALGVPAISDYTGDPEAARKQIDEWIAAKVKAEAGTAEGVPAPAAAEGV